MTGKTENLEHAVEEILRDRYRNASLIFLAGSLVRGEGTATSDLDLVVVFQSLDCAYRESFVHGRWPVEAFVHDPQTLRYFFDHVDRPAGVPSLARMVVEGIEVPAASAFGSELKTLANAAIELGPPPWTQEEADASRYGITNLVDDLRDARSREESVATLTALYQPLADHYFRSRGLWSAKDKSIPRALQAHDPDFARRFGSAFDNGFADADLATVIALAGDILKPAGGFLFEGFSRQAPKEWRQP